MGSRSWGFIAGIVVGGALGAVATVAISPELDQETRRRLRDEVLQWRQRAELLMIAGRAEAEVLLARAQVLLEEQRGRLDEAVAAFRQTQATRERELRAKFDEAEREGEAHL